MRASWGETTRIRRIGKDNRAIRPSSCDIVAILVNPPRRNAQVNVQSLRVLKSDGDYVRVAITVDDREKAEAMLDAGELGEVSNGASVNIRKRAGEGGTAP